MRNRPSANGAKLSDEDEAGIEACLPDAAPAGPFGELPAQDALAAYREAAADHCARYNKVAQITSVHPWYGDFVGFACIFPPGYDPVKAWYGPPVR